MNKLFEEWIIKQFGEATKPMLKEFSVKDGYADQDINLIWVGFNAGVELAKISNTKV